MLRRGLDNSARKSGEERAPGAVCNSDTRESAEQSVLCETREGGDRKRKIILIIIRRGIGAAPVHE